MTFTIETDPAKTERTPNAVECDECGAVYEGGDVGRQNAAWDICPADEEHLAMPLLVSIEPLGLPTDQEYWHFGRDRHEYPLQASH